MAEAPLFFLIAGESSGDLLGARLMKALKKKMKGNVCFAGVGGERMQAEGMDLLFPQTELAHFGLFELLRHIPHIFCRLRQTIGEIKRRRPTALITIDAPDFCFRVAKQLRGQGIPLIHYVAPTVWAWRPKRAKKIAKFLDHLLALLPFEPPYFTRENLPCTFVGHPIIESDVTKGDAVRFRTTHQISEEVDLITLLPGSRVSEVNRLLPIFRETVVLLATKHPKLRIVMPTIAAVAAMVRTEIAQWSVPVIVTEGDQNKYDAFATSKAALACSGTVSVELAMAKLPTVIAYKVNAFTVFLYRRLIKCKFVTLVNIMQNRMIMPEFLQENCTPEKLTDAVSKLLSNPSAREQQITDLRMIAEWLGEGQFIPSEKAADVVLGVISKQSIGI